MFGEAEFNGAPQPIRQSERTSTAKYFITASEIGGVRATI